MQNMNMYTWDFEAKEETFKLTCFLDHFIWHSVWQYGVRDTGKASNRINPCFRDFRTWSQSLKDPILKYHRPSEKDEIKDFDQLDKGYQKELEGKVV